MASLITPTVPAESVLPGGTPAGPAPAEPVIVSDTLAGPNPAESVLPGGTPAGPNPAKPVIVSDTPAEPAPAPPVLVSDKIIKATEELEYLKALLQVAETKFQAEKTAFSQLTHKLENARNALNTKQKEKIPEDSEQAEKEQHAKEINLLQTQLDDLQTKKTDAEDRVRKAQQDRQSLLQRIEQGGEEMPQLSIEDKTHKSLNLTVPNKKFVAEKDAGLTSMMQHIDHDRVQTASNPKVLDHRAYFGTKSKMTLLSMHKEMKISLELLRMVKFFREESIENRKSVFEWGMKVYDPTGNQNEYVYLAKGNNTTSIDRPLEMCYLSEGEYDKLNSFLDNLDEDEDKEKFSDGKTIQNNLISNFVNSMKKYYKLIQNMDHKEQFQEMDHIKSEMSEIKNLFQAFANKDSSEDNDDLTKKLKHMTEEYEEKIKDHNENTDKSIRIIQDYPDILDAVLQTWSVGSTGTYTSFLSKWSKMEKNIAFAKNVLEPQYLEIKKITEHEADYENYKIDMISAGLDAGNRFSDMKILLNWRKENDSDMDHNLFEVFLAQYVHYWNEYIEEFVQDENHVKRTCENLKNNIEAQVYWRHYLQNAPCEKDNLEAYLKASIIKRLLGTRTVEDIVKLCQEHAADVESCELLTTHFGFENNQEESFETQNKEIERHLSGAVERNLRQDQLNQYMWTVSKAAYDNDNGFKLKHKEVKQNNDDGDEANQASKAEPQPRNSQNSQPQAPEETQPQTSQEFVSQTSHGTSKVPEPKNTTSAAPPSIGWDATMILAFLIVVFIAN